MDTITYANTHIHPCMPIWHVLKQRLCWAVFSVLFGICDHNTGKDKAGGRQGKKEESEERQEQTNKTNLVKPSAGLGLGRECVCVCEAIWTECRGLGQILGCPTHSWLMIQSWSTAQRTSRHGTPGCVHASACVSLCVSACVYRHVDSTDVCISVHICRHAVVQTNVCACTCVNQKEGRAIRNQTEAVCALCPLFEGGLWSFGPPEEDRMKEGSKQVAKRESKSCLSRLVIQMPSSLATVNPTLLLFNNTNTVTQTSPLQLQRFTLGSVVSNKRGQTKAWLRMNYIYFCITPEGPQIDIKSEKKPEVERMMETIAWGLFV